jgi:flavin-binding monooxygenase-like protein
MSNNESANGSAEHGKGQSLSGACRDMTDKICIVGAGPAGLSVSRAFSRLKIPHDVIERHNDVGGIWDISNPGSPMYQSAHFISSKFTSNFMGYPMPEGFPDYPDHRQILEYIKSFANAYDLRRNITFETEVEHCSETEEKNWLVQLSNGETRKYKGLVCCNGVTWHPAMPEFKGRFNGKIIHANEYRDTDQFRGKRVLIVGLGNSGADIACDAAQAADEAFISVRRGYHFIPKFVFGIPTDVYHHHLDELPDWMQESGLETILQTICGDPTRFDLPTPDHDPFASHPLMNTELLHYLGHGDIHAKPDVETLDGDYIEFVDGSREKIDLIVCATGYQQKIPYVPDNYFEWRGERPILYMNTFSATHPRLFVMGFFEVASGAYQLYDRIANLVAHNIIDTMNNPGRSEKFDDMKDTDKTDLRGGHDYVNSDRHANYIDYDTYMERLSWICAEMGWPEVEPGWFAQTGVLAEPNSIKDALGLA